MTETTARRTIGSYPSYADAQRVVDTLSDRRFPVEHVQIVGRDLRMVEKVTGRVTVAKAALAGAATGAWFGLFLGLVFVLITPYTWAPLFTAVLLGALFGAVFGAVAHAATGGRRDFASVSAIVADHYDVEVAAEHAEAALTALGGDVYPAEPTLPTADAGARASGEVTTEIPADAVQDTGPRPTS